MSRPLYEYVEGLIDPLVSRPVVCPPDDTPGFFRHHLNSARGAIGATLLLAGIAAISELYLYFYLGRILDWMTSEAREGFIERHAVSLLVMAVVVGIVRPLSLVASRAIINLAIAPGLANATRWQNHRYVLRQSMAFFENDFAGRISQKVMQTGHALREAVVNVLDGAWLLVIYLFGIAVMFSDMNHLLLLPVVVWTLAYLAVIGFMVPPVRRRSADLSEANSSLIGRIVDSYTNIQSVKLFAHHVLEEDFAAEGIRRQNSRFHALMRSILDMTVTLTALNTGLVLATAALSIHLWLSESITVGEIAVANGLVIRLNQMSGWILRTITSLFENVGAVQNGMQTIARPLAVTDEVDARQLQVSSGRVTFANVSFHYDDDNTRPLVDRCSFEVAPGERIGLVGRSGAGKSTLVSLLMRFRDVDDGHVRIDGTDIREVDQRSLRAAIAVVTQDTSLLHRSLRDNIRYGRPEASDAEVRQAAERAEAMGFVDDLVDPQGRRGLDAHVGERGVKLSGGQRQRIAIARVILKDAPILVLDEATSALDSEVEAAIQGRLDELMHGKTVIAVAHRLSTIAALDRLVVLDGGRIIESGSHAELVQADGLYARLWRRQSGGFIGR